MRFSWAILSVVFVLVRCGAAYAWGPPRLGISVTTTDGRAGPAAVATSLDPPTGVEPDSLPEPGPGNWFYRGLPYGSDALIHPVRLILNGGFGALQFNNRSNRIADVRFEQGWNRLWDDLGSSGSTIRRSGWNEFLRTEVIPVSANRQHSQYWPNYTLHLIGGGMSSTMMREWFTQHGYAHPELGSLATLAAYHMLNETVEASGRSGPSTDAIADLLIFDPAGWLLFRHDGVNGFFSRTLNLRDWSNQLAFDLQSGTIENHGQSFAMKLDLPTSDHWSLFYYFGNHGELGLTHTAKDGSAISVGAGLKASNLVDLDNGAQTADLVPCAGLFYDRNGSLMFSVMTAKASRYDLQVNAYPGLLSINGWTAGLFFTHARSGGQSVGINFTRMKVGLAAHRGP